MLDEKVKELLPSIIKDTMDALSDMTNATDEITVPTVLSVATFATQGLVNAQPLLWDSCAISNYYCVVVESGGLKTSTLDLVLKGARKFEENQRQFSEQEQIKYEVELAQYQDEIKKLKKDPIQVPGTPNPFTQLVKPKYPRGTRYMSSKFTLNGILEALKGVPHFGIFNSDAAEFFNSYSFTDKEKGTEMISALSRLWSGEQIDKLTGMEDVVTKGKRTTAMFMIQPNLADFFINTQYTDQGFIPRILITQSDKIDKKRADFSDAGLSKKMTTDERLSPFNDRVYELLASVDTNQQKPKGKGLFAIRQEILQQQNRDINTLILGNQDICMTDSTRQILEEFYNDMIFNKQEDEKYSGIKSFIHRAYEHCIRIATVLSRFDMRDEVNENDAGAAVGLMYYFIEQRLNLNIDGSVRTNPIVECSNRVKRFLVKNHTNKWVTKTILNNNGPTMYKNMSLPDRDKVLDELQSRGWIEIENKKLRVVT